MTDQSGGSGPSGFSLPSSQPGGYNQPPPEQQGGQGGQGGYGPDPTQTGWSHPSSEDAGSYQPTSYEQYPTSGYPDPASAPPGYAPTSVPPSSYGDPGAMGGYPAYPASPGYQPSYAGYGQPGGPGGPKQTNGLALGAMITGIAAAVLGVFGICCYLFALAIPAGIVAAILGFIGMKPDAQGQPRPGKGMAIAGIITGIVGFLAGLLWLILVVVVAATDIAGTS